MTRFLISMLVFANLASLTLDPSWAGEKISLVVSSSVYPELFAKFGPSFEKKTGLTLVYVNDPANSKTSQPSPFLMKEILDGKAEAAASAIPFDEWVKTYQEKYGDHPILKKLTHRVIGKELIRVVSHPGIGVKKLSMPQLEGLFTGKITSWKEVGGEDIPVKLVIQEGVVARTLVFKKKVLPGKDFPAGYASFKEYDQMMQYLASTPGALSFMPEKHARANEGRILLPETEEIGRPITLASVGRPSENLLKLAEFIRDSASKH